MDSLRLPIHFRQPFANHRRLRVQCISLLVIFDCLRRVFAAFFQMRSITSSVGCGSKVPSWADLDVQSFARQYGKFSLLFSHRAFGILLWDSNRESGRPLMGEKKDVLQGTLALMILKTLEA